MSSHQFRDYSEPRRSSLGRKIVLGLIGILLIFFAAVGLARYGEDLPLIGWLFGGGTIIEEGRDDVTFTDIQDLNQLTTTRWIGQVVVTEDAEPGRVQSLAGAIGVDTSAFTGESVIITATGEVEAGVNLDEMNEGDVRVNGESVTIDLPNAEILSSSLDEDRTGVYDRDRGIFVRGINDALVEDARRDAVANIEQSAEESGILDQANSNAETSLRGFIESLGYREVTFE